MRLDLTPWARRDIDPVVQEILSGMEPRRGTVHIGRGQRDWRALATFSGWVIADIRAGTALGAAEKLIEFMSIPIPWNVTFHDDQPEQADGMTQAKAREFVEWRGTEVEVTD